MRTMSAASNERRKPGAPRFVTASAAVARRTRATARPRSASQASVGSERTAPGRRSAARETLDSMCDAIVAQPSGENPTTGNGPTAGDPAEVEDGSLQSVGGDGTPARLNAWP